MRFWAGSGPRPEGGRADLGRKLSRGRGPVAFPRVCLVSVPPPSGSLGVFGAEGYDEPARQRESAMPDPHGLKYDFQGRLFADGKTE